MVTKKHMDKEKGNNSLKNRNGVFLRWICASIIVISLIEIAFTVALFWLLYTNKISVNTFNCSMESSLLASGIAIIGAAISVWAGLNIANAIERNEYEKLKEKTDTLAEALEEKSQDVAQLAYLIDQGTTQFRELEKKDVQRSAKYEEVEKIALLNELSITSNDAATRRLMNIVNSYKSENGFPITELIRLERYFRLVYEKHNSTFHKDMELLAYADEGIRIADSILALTSNEELSAYIVFRKAELLFYSGYCLNGEDKIAAFRAAVQLYFKASKSLNANLPNFKEPVVFEKITYEGCSLNQVEISAYMCNTIGEAYSKIIEGLKKGDPLLDEYGPKAIFYCAYAAKWNECELYLRNLGCAIERNEGKDSVITNDLYVQLHSIYRKSLNLKFTINTIKVSVSIMDKYINGMLGIESTDKPKEKRGTPLYSSQYIDRFDDLSVVAKNQIQDMLHEIHNLSSKAKLLFPTQIVGYTYECIYFRDMSVLSIRNIAAAKEYIEFAKKELEYMELLAREAPLTTILKNDIEDIENYLDSSEQK